MTDEAAKFNKKVDEDWKAQARRERDKLLSEQRTGETAAEEEADQIFMQFIGSLIHQTQVDMGLVEHPMTGRREPQLDQARYMIDVLRSIDRKTRPTQTPTEKDVFKKVLTELQMLYVQLTGQGGAPGSPAAPGGPAGTAGGPAAGGVPGAAP